VFFCSFFGGRGVRYRPGVLEKYASGKFNVRLDDPALEDSVKKPSEASIPRSERSPVLLEDANAPIFIMGGSHSGSSLLQQLVGVHPNIMALPESYIFRNNPSNVGKMVAPEFLDHYTQPPWNSTQARGVINRSKTVVDLAANFFGRFTQLHGKRRWSEKTPQHMWHIERIHNLFPDSPMILILRHPEDVIGSLMHKRSWDPYRAVDRWVTQYSAALEYLHAPWMLLIYYEDLVTAPQEAMDTIFTFLGEEVVTDVEEKLMKDTFARDLLVRTQGGNNEYKTKADEVIKKISPIHAFSSRKHFSSRAKAIFEQGQGPNVARDLGLDLNGTVRGVQYSIQRLRHNLWLSTSKWKLVRMGLVLGENTTTDFETDDWKYSEQRHMELSIGGPSVIHMSSNVRLFHGASGRYFMYFASHRSKYIRLATAPSAKGPWKVSNIKVVHVDDHTCLRGHVASPAASMLNDGTLSLFFHSETDSGQQTFEAKSLDGTAFNVDCERGPLGPFYFAPFTLNGVRYAVAKNMNRGGVILQETKTGPWGIGPELFPRMRHATVFTHDDDIHVVYTRHGDKPERLLLATCRDSAARWRTWSFSEAQNLLIPERDWEGFNRNLEISLPGAAVRVRELRDPFVFYDSLEDVRYVFYSVQGEGGIAVAKLSLSITFEGNNV